MHYFLKVAGATGDSTDAAHPGWFEVDGFDFGVTTATSAGLGIGRSHISPLSVDIHSSTGLATLFADELTNHTLASVELVGVEGGERQQTVYDLKLVNVSLDSQHYQPGPQGVEADLAFNFQRGSLIEGETARAFGASSGTAASAAQLSAATPVPDGSPVEYFLNIPGATGDSTDASHPGWFDVDGFGVGVTTPTNAGTGTHVGRAHFSSLTVDIHSLTGVTTLMADEASHHLIKSAELVGVQVVSEPNKPSLISSSPT